MGNLGLLLVRSNSELDADQAERDALQFASEKSEANLKPLAAHIRRCWETAKTARAPITDRFTSCLRRRNGEYDPSTLTDIREAGGSDVFVMLTDEKCSAAESWLEDVLFPAGEKPWSVEPTPKPEVPGELKKQALMRLAEEVQAIESQGLLVADADILRRAEEYKTELEKIVEERARETADRMENAMEDFYRQGDFYRALRECLHDFTTYPVAYLKGPVIRRKKTLSWAGGSYTAPVVSYDPAPEWERVSPFDIYPAPSATKIGEGYLIHINWLTDEALYALIGVEGFDEEEIRELLAGKYGSLANSLWAEEHTRQALEDRPNEWMDQDGRIPAIQFWGPIKGQLLREWGMSEKDVPDTEKPYDVEAWMVGPCIIKATLNPDPLGRIPYHKASYREKPGSWYGRAVPELMADAQDMCNAAVRALANNMGLSSGPQVIVDASALPAGTSIEGLSPWKIWQFNGLAVRGSGKPIDFFQPPSNATELLGVYEKFSTIAENVTGIPRYSYGQGGGSGVLSTASGMAMMMNNAAKGLKKALSGFDHGIIEPSCEHFYDWLMQFSTDSSIKGDCRVIARGSSALIFREQQTLRRNEFLQSTANPVDLQIMGVEGRRELLRENAKALDLPTDKIIPEAQAAPPQQQALPPGAPGPEAGVVEPQPDPMAIPGRLPTPSLASDGVTVRDGGSGARIV